MSTSQTQTTTTTQHYWNTNGEPVRVTNGAYQIYDHQSHSIVSAEIDSIPANWNDVQLCRLTDILLQFPEIGNIYISWYYNDKVSSLVSNHLPSGRGEKMLLIRIQPLFSGKYEDHHLPYPDWLEYLIKVATEDALEFSYLPLEITDLFITDDILYHAANDGGVTVPNSVIGLCLMRPIGRRHLQFFIQDGILLARFPHNEVLEQDWECMIVPSEGLQILSKTMPELFHYVHFDNVQWDKVLTEYMKVRP